MPSATEPAGPPPAAGRHRDDWDRPGPAPTSVTTPEPRQPPGREPDRVRLDSLRWEPCVRWQIDDAHVAVLAEVLEDCPPITITSDGRIVDGLHRAEAARRRGWATIPALRAETRNDIEVIIAAARANSRHGKPLSSAERRRAVERILAEARFISDRQVAAICGVSRATVATAREAVRDRSGGSEDHLNTRLGADGKHYAKHGEDIRALADALVRTHADLTVRALADQLGVSVGTAHHLRGSVLERLAREPRLVRWYRRLKARWRLRWYRHR